MALLAIVGLLQGASVAPDEATQTAISSASAPADSEGSAGYDATAEMLVGGTSNVRRTADHIQGDTITHFEAFGSGHALRRRLRGQAEVGLRTPLGITDLRQFGVGADVDYGQPVGALEVGATASFRFNDEISVFTETGTLPRGSVRTDISARVRPRIAWTDEPWRIELAAQLTAKDVSGAETYAFTDVGGELGARYFPSTALRLGMHGAATLRRFDGLYVRKRDGERPSVAPALDLRIASLGFDAATYPLLDLELVAGLTVTRFYDGYDSYHSGQRARLELRTGWFPDSGINAECSMAYATRNYVERFLRIGQPQEESELEMRVDLSYPISTWLAAALRYELHHARSDEAGTLYTEHVTLMGVRSKL